MALALTNITLPNGLVAPNVYSRVMEFAPRRVVKKEEIEGVETVSWEETTRIWTNCYIWDGVTPPAKDAKPFREYTVWSVDYILTGNADTPDNVFKLAYDALKTLPEFAGATDV